MHFAVRPPQPGKENRVNVKQLQRELEQQILELDPLEKEPRPLVNVYEECRRVIGENEVIGVAVEQLGLVVQLDRALLCHFEVFHFWVADLVEGFELFTFGALFRDLADARLYHENVQLLLVRVNCEYVVSVLRVKQEDLGDLALNFELAKLLDHLLLLLRLLVVLLSLLAVFRPVHLDEVLLQLLERFIPLRIEQLDLFLGDQLDVLELPRLPLVEVSGLDMVQQVLRHVLL